MSRHYAANVWEELAEMGDGVRGERLVRAPDGRLGAAVWETDPGTTQQVYHFHHGTEELLIVLRGRPTLRGPEGERQLEEGDVVPFPAGPAGAHQIVNRSDDVARVVIVAAHGSPDVIEYPDSAKLVAGARTESQRGGPLFALFRLDDALDYATDAPE